MIDKAEAVYWARRFGVDLPQIHRDHLISHVLHALPNVADLADGGIHRGDRAVPHAS